MRTSKNAYYNWLKNKDSIAIETTKSHLKKRIQILFQERKEIYGSARIQKMLEREGLSYSGSYVGLLMK